MRFIVLLFCFFVVGSFLSLSCPQFFEHKLKVDKRKQRMEKRVGFQDRGGSGSGSGSGSRSGGMEEEDTAGRENNKAVIKISIPSYDVRADASGKNYTLYNVAVKSGEEQWVVFRRFSQFEELAKKIEAKKSLPGKRIFGNFDVVF